MNRPFLLSLCCCLLVAAPMVRADDAGASKLHKGEPVGLAHGLLYVEIIDRPGTDNDRMLVRSYVTRDNWETARWDRLWEKPIQSPDRESVDASTTR